MLICLRVFATGGHLISIGDFGGCHKSTVSRIVVRVASAIARLAPRFIKFPNSEEDIRKTQRAFFDIAAFPRVTGVIDCTHIKIQSVGKLLLFIQLYLQFYINIFQVEKMRKYLQIENHFFP